MAVQLLAIALALAIMSPAAIAFDITTTCKIAKSGTYISDPSSCSGWAYCQNGVVAGRGNCSSGLFYDVHSARCEDATTVDCQSNVKTMCEGSNEDDDEPKPHPNDCNQYCYCYQGKAKCLQCPQYQVFNEDTVECVWSDKYTCTANSPCKLVANNQFVGDGKDCSKYYRCIDGLAIEGQCGQNQAFNSLTGRCDWARNVPCWSSQLQPLQIGVPHPTNTTCSQPPKDVNSEKQFFVSDGETCRGSFVCKNTTDANPQWTQCPEGTQFSFEQQKCIDPCDANCEYADRCDGLPAAYQFVAVYGSDCKRYEICKNGQTVANSENQCYDPKFPYFDEIAQACVPEKPKYGICETSTRN